MCRYIPFVAVFCLFGLAHAQWNVKIPPKPPIGFVLDQASLLDLATIQRINGISDGAMRTAHAPIVVVTIPSLAGVGADNVEFYATTLFNAWAIGDRKVNRGVLLLVAQQDHKARIEMGAGWGYTKDRDCDQIMSNWIIPSFKRSEFSKGILDGVVALDALVRTGKAPSPPLPAWFWPTVFVATAIVLWIVIDLVRHGTTGPAANMLSAVGRGMSHIVLNINVNSGSSSSGWSSGGGGGFSGGGSSGGGGSTGSW